MNEQEIIDNAPDLIYTHYSESQSIYISRNFDGSYKFKTSGKTESWIGNKLGLTRSIADVKHILELEKNAKNLAIKELKKTALIMANARRLIKAKAITSNDRLYYELFGTGFQSARSACKQLGLDPSSNKTNYNEMCKYINTIYLESNG
jgi:hypothetical protein